MWSRSILLCLAPSHAQYTLSIFCSAGYWWCVAVVVNKFSLTFLLLSREYLILFYFPGCEDFWHHLKAENHQCASGWYKSSPRYVSLQPLLEGQCDTDYWLGDFCQGCFACLYNKSMLYRSIEDGPKEYEFLNCFSESKYFHLNIIITW